MSDLLDFLGLVSLTAGAYELAGRGVALIVLAGCFFFLGLSSDGVHPVAWARARIALRWRRFKTSP